MRRSCVLVLFLLSSLLLLAAIPFAIAQDDPSDVLVYNMWAEPGVTADETRAYLTIENTGDTVATLISATSTAANTVSIFTDHSEGELVVEPGENGDLTPGGAYLLLQGLQGDFTIGDAIPLTLTLTVEGSALPINLPVAVQVADAPPAASEIVVANAWARPTALERTEGEAAISDTGSAYLTLLNRGDEPAYLVGVTADIAAMPAIHETVIENNVAQMPMVTQVEIPAQGRVDFAPAGFHLMLAGLTQHLVPGDTFTITLQFESGETLTTAVPVIDESAQ